MRALPDTLDEALRTGVTTLCRAWAVTRTDGVRLGFTDHDRALAFDGLVFEAASGFTASTVEQATGLAVDSHTVAGALRSAAIASVDIERGLYDGAEIVFWLVDWTDPASRLLLARGRIGEIRRGELAFEAEVVGLAELLNQPYGRAYIPACDLRLGEPRCGVDLSDPAYLGRGIVIEASGARLTASGLDAFEGGWFARGLLTWTEGANAGQAIHVRAHRTAGGTVTLELWEAPVMPVSAGDAFDVTAGCDKRLETCRAKFANSVSFRGFPHVPGDDWAATYPNIDEVHDGGSLFRR
jgi:uncharacterized phage protein (TIGR02218 family)